MRLRRSHDAAVLGAVDCRARDAAGADVSQASARRPFEGSEFVSESIFDDPGLFGRLWAEHYDGGPVLDPAPAVDFLADLAADGRVLELAIGTGRVALPLAERGIAIEGVEASEEMVAKMRAKQGGADIPVAIGDMADVPVIGPYTVVFLVYNTIFNLVREERQRDCFRNVARVLAPGGAFVIETFVPDPADFDRDERVQVQVLTEDSATLRLHQYNRAEQTFIRQIVTFDAAGVHLRTSSTRWLRRPGCG
jgi:SAM-dependent methyltransferase